MTTIRLNDILQQNSDYSVAGTKFYDSVKSDISESKKVVVDMENVTSLPSIFLNFSFGKIIDEYGTDAVKKLFTFVKITKVQAERLQNYILKYQH